MKADPFSVYAFRAQRADRITLVFGDGTDLCLFAERLEEGVFPLRADWPWVRTAAGGEKGAIDPLDINAGVLDGPLRRWGSRSAFGQRLPQTVNRH